MSLINFKKKLENFKKNKYQRSIFNYNDFIIREKIKKKIIYFEEKKISFNHKCNSCVFFENEFKNKDKILIYYKKFNSNLILKYRYNKFFRKVSNDNSCLKVLQKLSFKIYDLKEINHLQKLNTILKINDLFILNFLKKKNLPKSIGKNFELELKLLKKVL